jgi:hypothetical protein
VKVGDALDGEVSHEQPIVWSHQPNGVAIFGLGDGYSGRRMVGIARLKRELNTSARGLVTCRPVDVLSVSPDSVYTEPAAKITFGQRSDCKTVLDAAVAYHQERFSLEVPRRGRVYMVETEHCDMPDNDVVPLRSASAVIWHAYRTPVPTFIE